MLKEATNKELYERVLKKLEEAYKEAKWSRFLMTGSEDINKMWDISNEIQMMMYQIQGKVE